MHSTRSEVIRGIPLPRKGTKYVATALRFSRHNVPVVIAVREMLNLAATMKEVKQMVHSKMLKINGKIVTDLHQPIPVFGVFHADKNYRLTLQETGRFTFEETSDSFRAVKITGKRLVTGGMEQYSLHDGTCILSKDKISVGDTLILDFENKMKKHVAMEKGKKAFVISGSNIGLRGTISKIEGHEVTVKIEDAKEEVVLDRAYLMVQ